jgi:hypothetical protein
MCLTTAQKLYFEFRSCDNASDFESEVDDIHLLDGSSFTIEDERSFSIASDFSEITYGNFPSDSSPTTTFAIENERSFSNISDLSDDTFTSLLSETADITATDEQEDMMIESSEAIFEDHASSMVVFLELTRHKPTITHSFSIEMIRDSVYENSSRCTLPSGKCFT